MGLFTSKEFDSLEALFIDQLQDVYDAEHRITEALPKMAKAADSPQLTEAFNMHLEETKHQIERLEQIFDQIGQSPQRKTCEAMKGLIAEGEEIVQAKGSPDVRDAALIGAAQRVEHYEIASYGTLRNFARRLGNTTVADLLQKTLDEEGATDKKLTQLAESSINVQAQTA